MHITFHAPLREVKQLCCYLPVGIRRRCWMCSKNAFDAEHFPLENVMLNILQSKMYAEHFPLENVMQKCIFAQPKCILPLSNILVCKNAFLHQQNVRVASLFFAKQKTQHFCIKCILASNAFVTFCFALQKCIFASNAFLHQQNVRIFVFCKAKNTAFLHS